MNKTLTIIVVVAAIIFGWMLNDTITPSGEYEVAPSDTAWVEIPLPVIEGQIPAKPITPLKEGVGNEKLKRQAEEAKATADSLRIVLATNETERDIFLENTLPLLLAPKSAETEIEGPNYKGHLELGFIPMPLPGSFEYKIQITPRVPYITHNFIRREPWWVKPAVAVTAAAAIYYFERDRPVHALVLGGTSITLTLVEF